MGERIRHKKRDSEYTILGSAMIQTDEPLGDGAAVVVYVSDSGQIWVRRQSEMYDGRFEFLPDAGEQGHKLVKIQRVVSRRLDLGEN